jgi:hypothetical protein
MGGLVCQGADNAGTILVGLYSQTKHCAVAVTAHRMGGLGRQLPKKAASRRPRWCLRSSHAKASSHVLKHLMRGKKLRHQALCLQSTS